MYYDWTMILLLPAILLSAWAQYKVSSTYSKYGKVASKSGVTAAQMARTMLDYNGLSNISVEQVAGNLTDHYDPKKKVLRLSQTVYGSSSVAALGVAAHEAGHAMQDAESYIPLKVRGALVPLASFGSYASWVLIAIGLVMGAFNLLGIGILLFSLAVLFQLVTLPVEFNASRRAMAALEGGGYLDAGELTQTRKVLSAAAMTYVAAALTAVLQLLRLLLIFGRRN
ncbi:MAG: zinc metallopeptidase [Bacillota bacterium]|nr:zinc metallopeptidase [Bacillota bacterium]